MRSRYLIGICLFIMLLVSDNNKPALETDVARALTAPNHTAPIVRHTEDIVPIITTNAPKKDAEQVKILITSFGPYNEFDPNPSQVLMTYVQKHYRRNNVKIVFKVLETSYEYCEHWMNHIQLSNYDLIIHTGVDGMTEAFELERFATKIPNFPESDNENKTSSSTSVFETGDELYATKINLDSVIKSIQSNHCIIVSEDAGGYLCNFIYYLSSYTAQRKHVPTDIIFVHIPPFENLDLKHQYPIFKDILDVLIKYEYSKKKKSRT